MLKVRNLESGYGDLRVLKGVTLHVEPGEIVTIIGANGAGKSTLLNTITGTVKPRGGSILFKGDEISNLRTEKIVRRGCSLVPEGRQRVHPPMDEHAELRVDIPCRHAVAAERLPGRFEGPGGRGRN